MCARQYGLPVRFITEGRPAPCVPARRQPSKVRRREDRNAGDVCEASRPSEPRSRRVFGRTRFTCRDMTCAKLATLCGIIPIIRKGWVSHARPPERGQGILPSASWVSPHLRVVEDLPMDYQVFDRLARLFAASGSRRTTWRALLGAALLGATTSPVGAAPGATPCDTGEQARCGDQCCPGRCFVDEVCGDQLCCRGPELTICGNMCCRSVDEAGRKLAAPCSGACIPPKEGSCQSGLPTRYRRP
jgi:hypothetical protein